MGHRSPLPTMTTIVNTTAPLSLVDSSGFPSLALDVVLPNETLLYGCLIVIGLVFLLAYPRIFSVLARELPALILLLTFLGGVTYTYVCLEIATQLGPYAASNGAVQLLRSSLVGCAVFVLLSLAVLFMPSHATLSTSSVIKEHTQSAESMRIRFRRFVFALLIIFQVFSIATSSITITRLRAHRLASL